MRPLDIREKPVWVWLPGRVAPVRSGILTVTSAGEGRFTYDQSYLDEVLAVPLDPIELRYQRRVRGIPVRGADGLPGVIHDASPAGYGRELLKLLHGTKIRDPLDLLELGDDDAVGAIAVCDDIERKLRLPRHKLSDLATAVAGLEATQSPSRAIRRLSGDEATSAGGDRPKITLEHEGRLWLAKMQDRNDVPHLPAKEYFCMRMARVCGIEVPDVALVHLEQADVFLVERFDRVATPDGFARRLFGSAHTALRLDPLASRGDASRSYLAFADAVGMWMGHGQGFDEAKREIWRRMSFNALVGNLDDHPRNHGLICDMGGWRLSPAFDITPLGTFDRLLAMGTHADGSCDASPVALLRAASYLGYTLAEAQDWLESSAKRIAQTWERELRENGVGTDAIDQVRPAFAISSEIAERPKCLDEAITQIFAEGKDPARRRASSLRRRP